MSVFNTDYRIQTSWQTHPKRKRLKRLLGSDGVLAIQDLWGFCAVNRPDGTLSSMDKLDIAIAADFDGDENEFVDALVDLRLLDVNEDGVHSIHDWDDHQPWCREARERKERARKAAQARWGSEEEPDPSRPTAPKKASVDTQAESGNASSDMPTDAQAYSSMPEQMPEHQSSNAPFPSLPLPSLPLPSSPSHSPPLPPSPSEKFKPPNPLDAKAEQVLAHYRSVHPGSPGCKRGSKTWQKLRARLREFSVTQLCAAIEGNAEDEWYRARGKHELSFVCQSDARVNEFISKRKVQLNPPVEAMLASPNSITGSTQRAILQLRQEEVMRRSLPPDEQRRLLAREVPF